MLNFDEGTIIRLNSSTTKLDDKLYLISRYIEEKYGFETQPNYWDSALDSMEERDKIFYKLWLWLCYVEWETLVEPVREFKAVFGPEEHEKLLLYLAGNAGVTVELRKFYSMDNEAGRILLEWGLSKLDTSFNDEK